MPIVVETQPKKKEGGLLPGCNAAAALKRPQPAGHIPAAHAAAPAPRTSSWLHCCHCLHHPRCWWHSVRAALPVQLWAGRQPGGPPRTWREQKTGNVAQFRICILILGLFYHKTNLVCSKPRRSMCDKPGKQQIRGSVGVFVLSCTMCFGRVQHLNFITRKPLRAFTTFNPNPASTGCKLRT